MSVIHAVVRIHQRHRLLSILVWTVIFATVCLAYSANAFMAGVRIGATFGIAPWSPIDVYVGAICIDHADSFWKRFLIIDDVQYVSNYYQAVDSWVTDTFPGIGVVEEARWKQRISDGIVFTPAIGQRLVRQDIFVRIQRYNAYTGSVPTDERDQARIAIRFKFLWTRFTVKAGYDI